MSVRPYSGDVIPLNRPRTWIEKDHFHEDVEKVPRHAWISNEHPVHLFGFLLVLKCFTTVSLVLTTKKSAAYCAVSSQAQAERELLDTI